MCLEVAKLNQLHVVTSEVHRLICAGCLLWLVGYWNPNNAPALQCTWKWNRQLTTPIFSRRAQKMCLGTRLELSVPLTICTDSDRIQVPKDLRATRKMRSLYVHFTIQARIKEYRYFLDVWRNFNKMQIIFKAITGVPVTPSGGKESAALHGREKNLSQKPRSWSLPWEVLFAR